jgi:hypothetical protein
MSMLQRGLMGSMGVLAVATSLAHGQPDQESRWRFTPIIGSDLGIDLGAGLQVETPFRLRLTSTVGWMPRGYAWFFKKYIEGAYDVPDPVANVVEDLVSGALVVRANVGYRLLPHRGLFAAAGYTLQAASKNGLIATALEEATGRELPGGNGPRRLFDTTTHAQMFDFQLGWQWPLPDRFSIQASVGFILVVSTSTTLEPAFVPDNPALLDAFIQLAEKRLEDAGQGTIAPLGAVFLGYTF